MADHLTPFPPMLRQEDAAIRTYALSAMFNLCVNANLMAELHQMGALPIVRSLSDQTAFEGGTEARHANEVLKQLKKQVDNFLVALVRGAGSKGGWHLSQADHHDWHPTPYPRA